MKFSNRVKCIKSSSLYSLYAKSQKMKGSGIKVIDLGCGEIIEPTNPQVKASGIKAIRNNRTKYTLASGKQTLKKEICKYLSKKKLCTSPDNISISSGSKILITAALFCLCDKKTHVIMPTPHYPPYLDLIKSFEGRLTLFNTEKNGFQIKASLIKKYLANKKNNYLLILVNPNNPTGMVYSHSQLEKIYRLSAGYNLSFIVDETYAEFEPGFKSFLSMPNLAENAIIIRSFSKGLNMSGWRIGYAISPLKLAKKINEFLNKAVGSPCEISQEAAITALKESAEISKEVRRLFSAKKEIYNKWRKNNCPLKKEIFYSFINLNKLSGNLRGSESEKFSEGLLEKYHVAVAPGTSFGDFKNYIRLCYAGVDKESLDAALKRINKFIST